MTDEKYQDSCKELTPLEGWHLLVLPDDIIRRGDKYCWLESTPDNWRPADAPGERVDFNPDLRYIRKDEPEDDATVVARAFDILSAHPLPGEVTDAIEEIKISRGGLVAENVRLKAKLRAVADVVADIETEGDSDG